MNFMLIYSSQRPIYFNQFILNRIFHDTEDTDIDVSGMA